MSEMKYKQGDILTNNNGYRKVLGVCGEVYLMSYDMQSAEEIDHVDFDVGFSQSLLDGCNYQLYTPPKEVEPKLSYKPFSPKEEEQCFYVDSWGRVLSGTYLFTVTKWSAESGNCFRTKEEAEYYRDWLIARKRIMDSSDSESAWENPEQEKWAIYYYPGNKSLEVIDERYYQYSSLPPYKSEEEAEQATQDLENEYLVYFGIKRSLED